MAITLTEEEFLELTEISHSQGTPVEQPKEQCLESDMQLPMPTCLGEGSLWTHTLRNSLTIEIYRGTFNQSLRCSRQHESDFPLVSKFYLSGMSQMETSTGPEVDSLYQEVAGYHYLYHLPEITEIEEWQADNSFHMVSVYAEPECFSAFNLAQDTLPMPLQRLFDGNRQQHFHQPLGRMNTSIRQLVQQIVTCPYTGLMRQLYLESKALELFAIQFAIWAETPSKTASTVLSNQDIEQLHQAKEILVEQATHPPSLTDLARHVGLNDRKLNYGFRRLFGTTVFGYLREYRMQQAKELLHQSELSIAGVAAAVGYTNPEAFSTAFRRQFSISPKAYQLRRR